MKNKNTIQPKTDNQQLYLDSLLKNKITFCNGPAGTGKTFLATLFGINALLAKKYDKLIISRPLVQSDLPTGHLPGSIEEKLTPYIRPVMDIISEVATKKEIETMVATKVIDIVPFGYMRGLTFKNSFIIFDEVQNCTYDQLILGLTRMGYGSKMVLSGDIFQSDLFKEKQGGMQILMSKLYGIEEIGMVNLNNSDIVREPIIQKILDRLNEETAQQTGIDA
jgi:phosphate starvation-inducible protein PhoH and related proteins